VGSGHVEADLRARRRPQVCGGVWVISAVSLRGLAGGFKNQAGQVEGDGERVADGHGFGGVIQAEGAGTFELPASLGGVAALGVGLPAEAKLPGFGAELGIASQAGVITDQVEGVDENLLAQWRAVREDEEPVEP